MDLSLNDTQQLIQDSAKDFVRGSCGRDVLLKLDRDPKLVMGTLWKPMSELGWTGMAIPEQYGGTGNSLTDVAVLDRKSTRLNSSHIPLSRMPASA